MKLANTVLRALEFICVFLESVVGGEEDLVKCANKAYDESLRKYHGWIVSGIFNVCNYTSLTVHSIFLTHSLNTALTGVFLSVVVAVYEVLYL